MDAGHLASKADSLADTPCRQTFTAQGVWDIAVAVKPFEPLITRSESHEPWTEADDRHTPEAKIHKKSRGTKARVLCSRYWKESHNPEHP